MLEFSISNWNDDYTGKSGAVSSQSAIADRVIMKNVSSVAGDGQQQFAIQLSDNSEVIFLLPSSANQARIIYRLPPPKK
jgi:hypothetical protein